MMASLAGSVAGLLFDVPVDPDGDQAREWIVRELSKPEYQAAKPTLWDQLSQGFWDWLNSLEIPGGAIQGPFFAIFLIVVAAAIISAFLIFGRPRRNRRSSAVGALFGDDEERSAEELRRAATRAAADRDWELAIEELFRSIARRMTERVIVATNPGTTANAFAVRAGQVFPAHAERLRSSAAAFDSVRYLGKPGSEADYLALVALEGDLRAAHPVATEAVAR